MRKALLATTLLAASVGVASAQVSPGSGSVTDAAGNTWSITSAGRIQENGSLVAGGGDTSALTVVNGTVWGQDNGDDANRANAGGWFTFGSSSGWTASATAPSGPTQGGATPTPTPTPTAPTGQTLNTLSPVVDQCSTSVPNYAASDGGFGTINGQFYDPSGQPWVAHGVNVADQDMGLAESELLTLMPNTNFIRLNVYSYQDPSAYQSFINWATSHGVVVEIDDHTSFPSNAFSGSQLSAETSFFSSMASAYKTNPYVWFETQNEPQGGDIADEQEAVYQAVRGAGNNNPVGLQLYGGGDPGFTSYMNASQIAGMTNVFVAPHFYDWLANYSSDPSTIQAALNSEISQAQSMPSADGTMPVIIDEYGDSTDGTNVDAGGAATVSAVANSGYGSAAWTLENWTGSSADALTVNGSLTSMGSTVAAAMTPTQGCAQSPVATAVSTPPAPTTSTDVTAPALVTGDQTITAPPLEMSN